LNHDDVAAAITPGHAAEPSEDKLIQVLGNALIKWGVPLNETFRRAMPSA
jgi:hypothetical protein